MNFTTWASRPSIRYLLLDRLYYWDGLRLLHAKPSMDEFDHGASPGDHRRPRLDDSHLPLLFSDGSFAAHQPAAAASMTELIEDHHPIGQRGYRLVLAEGAAFAADRGEESADRECQFRMDGAGAAATDPDRSG